MAKGWYNEPRRHALASKGVKTARERPIIYRPVKEELEVPGEVVMVEAMTPAKIKREMLDIMDDWKARGYNTPDEVPESPKKQRFRDLGRAIGMNIQF